MKRIVLPFFLFVFLCVCLSVQADEQAKPAFGQGIMVGEVTDTSAIVQVRVTQGTELVDGETYDDGDAMRDGALPGVESQIVFHYKPVGNAPWQAASGWVKAKAENDFIAKASLHLLEPGKEYVVWCEFADSDQNDAVFDKTKDTFATFKAHPGKNISTPVRFTLTSCMNYDKFIGNEHKGYQGEDRAMGYPAAEAVLKQKPDFVVYAGDVIYYDKKPKVKTLADMRAKWHRQNNLPRMIALHAAAPGYWMKDDHDHRTNDSDAERDYFPSHELGIKTFREQVPIVGPDDDETPTYRTFRVSKDLQVWFVEGRDYRDANKLPDGPDKTLWGPEQILWLKKTLLESDATYRILISPTPLVGPDDGYKSDNHTNPKGFRTEGEAFKQWGKANGIWKNTFLMCGDRHWQYHSIDPTGAHEFSCGALNDENSRMGRKPGDPKSTDPDGLVKQLFTSPKPTGGFITIVVDPGGVKTAIRFEYYDDLGEQLYNFTPGKK
ncbi:MAG: alkaline phosphatase D family protein [Phycisphaeraceae bacterium]|nr:alkaline phosphatase D family protein [Phycisphaeraceae bacterium]